jgi:branched-chain amino acid transport system substrate-binding protein
VAAWLGGPGLLGWAEANSVQLAVSQTNATGGVNIGAVTYTLALVTADDGCDATQAITAANTLINAGAVAVVAHSCSGASMAAQPLYNAAGVAMISPSASSPAVTQQQCYTTTFRTISHDGTPATLLATYFRDWLGLSRSAIVESWTLPSDFYSNTFTALGGTITSRRWVTSTSQFTATLATIQAENPQVIVNFFTEDPDPAVAGEFSKIAYGLGMTDVVIGWSPWGSNEAVLPVYANAAGPAAEGDHVAMEFRRFADMPGWPTFLAAYQAAGFPNEPSDPGPFGPFAYDAGRIIIAAIERADSTNRDAIRNQIAATRNYEGVVGTYQGFDACGDVIPQWAWLERYQDGQWVILNPGKLFLPVVLKNH